MKFIAIGILSLLVYVCAQLTPDPHIAVIVAGAYIILRGEGAMKRLWRRLAQTMCIWFGHSYEVVHWSNLRTGQYVCTRCGHVHNYWNDLGD